MHYKKNILIISGSIIVIAIVVLVIVYFQNFRGALPAILQG